MLSKDEAFKLTKYTYNDLQASAAAIRDEVYGKRITYSPNIYLPITQLCRDNCAYCAFAQSPENADSIYMSIDDVGKECVKAIESKYCEALLSLGEFPEDKYIEARNWLDENGYERTIDYIFNVASYILNNHGLLPHINAGASSAKDLARLKKVSASQGMYLETVAGRLSEPGGPHYNCPDKQPALRLSTLEAAGRAKIPFTTGILVGIGETREERIATLLAIRDLHLRFNHIQEVVIQNFVPKLNTAMFNATPAGTDEYLWSISAARLIFKDSTHIQATSINHSIDNLLDAGVDDLGAIKPITRAEKYPTNLKEHLAMLRIQLSEFNKDLTARACIYPEYIDRKDFVDDAVLPFIKDKVNSSGLLKIDPSLINWDTGEVLDLTELENQIEKKRDRNFPIKNKQ